MFFIPIGKYIQWNINSIFFIIIADVSGLSQRWNKLRRRCASFKAVSGPTSLDADASYILTEPVTQYAVVPTDRHQRSASVTPSIEHGSNKPSRPFSWRKSHSVEKYEYRDVNLNSSIPEKINKSIPLPEDYWKVHEQDVKVWKIGCAPPNRPVSLRDIPKDASEWEYSVQKYENLNTDRRANRIQYYTGDADTNRKHSLDNSERKEIKFPSLKAFKSASMRLPGQKSSLQEVHQMLRNKFNRLNVGLRKKRTLSVQEVFQSPPSQQKVQTPTQFYVPSPMPSSKVYIDGNSSTRSSASNEITSLPYYVNNAQSAKSTLNNQSSPTRNTSPVKSPASKNGVANKTMTRSESYRTKQSANDDGKKSPEKADNNNKPQFLVGGRVSLREKMPNKPSTAVKISNAVRDRIRRRPRSHSPVKPTESPSKTSNGRKNRDSGGFLDRINRIMSVNHLPPPHSGSPNNNNSSNNNMNQSKLNGSHESPSTAAAATKKVQNDETKSNAASKSPVNTNNVHNNSNGNSTVLSHVRKQQPQAPEVLFLRDRKITSKQVQNHDPSLYR